MLHIVAMLTNHNNFIANRFEQLRQVLVSTTLYTIQNNFQVFQDFYNQEENLFHERNVIFRQHEIGPISQNSIHYSLG